MLSKFKTDTIHFSYYLKGILRHISLPGDGQLFKGNAIHDLYSSEFSPHFKIKHTSEEFKVNKNNS